MILNKSFFSLAMYKNNLKRFKWGSLLYSLLLFFSVPFVLLVNDFESMLRRYSELTQEYSVILREDFLIFPMLFALVIPTVAAALIFNNVHSSRQSVFVHGLPVTRRENYISDILSGLTLMGLPVIANGIILLVMSVSKYSEVMPVSSVVYWAFLNLAVLFIMFSIAAATAFLTGNVAAHIGINAFFNVFPLILALTISVFCDEFLYGFVSDENFIANTMIQKTPIVWLFNNGVNLTYPKNISIFLRPEMWIYIIGAVLVYFIGYLLYRVRKVELSGDVVAFSVFRPIFKYLATASCAAVIFSILVQMEIARAFVYFEVLAGAAVVYFACEMLMNKSFKVFKSYKGFLGFAVASAIVVSFFAFTSVFGYETRVPKLSETEGTAIYTGRHFSDIPFIENEELIRATSEIHKSLVEKPFREKNRFEEGVGSFYVSYKLKNGKVLRRFYTVSQEMYDEALAKMYENTEYKLKVKDFDKLNIENAKKVELDVSGYSFGYQMEIANASEFLAAVKKDVENLSYEEIESNSSPIGIFVRFDITNEENKRLNIFKEHLLDERLAEDPHIVRSFSIRINENFENAFAFLKQNGYYDELMEKLSNSAWLYKKPVNFKRDTPEHDVMGAIIVDKSFEIAREDCVKLSPYDGEAAVLYMLSAEKRERPERGYYIFLDSSAGQGDVWFSGENFLVPENEIPSFLEKYLN